MWPLLLGLASAESHWLADGYVELPWAVTVPSSVRASQGTADAFRVLLDLECEEDEGDLVCSIEDAAIQGRATRPHVGVVGDELVAIRDGIIGARLTLEFDEGRLARTPDLDDDDLTQQQRALAERLIGASLAGFDGLGPGHPTGVTWIQEESQLVQVPGTTAQGVMSIRHTVDGELLRSEGEGSTRTPAGTGFLMQMGAEARIQDGELVDRWWWAAGMPMVSNASRAKYLQGGVLQRLEPEDHPLVGIGSGELKLEGPSIDAAVLGAGAYDGLRDFDFIRPPQVHALWLAGGPTYRRQHGHADALGYEISFGYRHPIGLKFGLAYGSHIPRDHEVLGRGWPVRAHDAMIGAWYRPAGERVGPTLGAFWGPSFRDYEITSPRVIWIPIAGGEIGIDFEFGRLSFAGFGRLTVDGASTKVVHGGSERILHSFEFTAGLRMTGRAVEWPSSS